MLHRPVELTLDTGYKRDYGEGVAYADYFADQSLMYNVPELNSALKNKEEVLRLIFYEQPEYPLAISRQFLKENKLYHGRLCVLESVVLSDDSGAHRVYASKGTRFFAGMATKRRSIPWASNGNSARINRKPTIVARSIDCHHSGHSDLADMQPICIPV